MSKKIFKFMLVALIIISVATSGFPVLAADSPSKKEEVIYASLDGRGAVQKAYAVNIFANEKSIRDYGNYSSIKNMNSDDKIVDENGAISFTTSTNPVFYQGYLKNTELPWNINIKYILDGREVRPKNLGGKSGHLEIKIDISKNSKCKGDFFKGYALQTTVKLDSNICNNIKAEGATFANVGGIKQLTYTIMPNKGKSILIQSDVKDFTMDGISINGIKLNLGIDKKSLNLSSFTNKINLLTKSISLLDNGASAVNTGSLNLNSGANNLSKGINKISTALVTLNGKSKSLTGGSAAVSKALSDIKSALYKVNMNTEELQTLASSSNSINAGINTLALNIVSLANGIDGIKSGINQYDASVGGINGVSNNTSNMISYLQSQINGGSLDNATVQTYSQIIGLLQAGKGAEDLLSGINSNLSGVDTENLKISVNTLKTNYNTFNSKITELVSTLTSLSSNMSKLKTAITELNLEYGSLDSGIGSYTKAVNQINSGYKNIVSGGYVLANGTVTLYKGTSSLLSGVGELQNGTKNMDSQINTQLDKVLQSFTGDSVPVKSFVDIRNTNVKSVQFVLTTDKISKPAKKEVKVKKEEKKGFVQKFIDLFK